MATHIDGNQRSFTCASAVEKNRRVTINASGQIAHAAASARGIGVTQRKRGAGEICPVRLFSASGTFVFTASSATAIPLGDNVKGAADGKVEYNGGTGLELNFINLGPATAADGDLLEVAKS